MFYVLCCAQCQNGVQNLKKRFSSEFFRKNRIKSEQKVSNVAAWACGYVVSNNAWVIAYRYPVSGNILGSGLPDSYHII